MNAVSDTLPRPAWLERLPPKADALCVAASIERHLPHAGWRQAIEDARAAGVPVDVEYLRGRWALARGAVRRTDPSTSHEAALRVTTSGTRADHLGRIIRAVREHPGKTSAELARLTELDRVEAARRTADAEREGRIHKGPKRRCTACGSTCVTWYPAPTAAQWECLMGTAA